MKANIHTNIVIVSILLSVMACGREESLSLEEAGGAIFTYSSPITSIVPAGDSLIVGSVDGRIAYFNTRNGLFSEQPYSMGGVIYDMALTPTYLYCSVRDGGVRRVDLYNPNSIPEVFEIEHKRSQYSPYDILLTDDNKTLYGATSNGFFKWDITNPSICGEAIDTLGENDPFRFIASFKRKVIALYMQGDLDYSGMMGRGTHRLTLSLLSHFMMDIGFLTTVVYQMIILILEPLLLVSNVALEIL